MRHLWRHFKWPCLALVALAIRPLLEQFPNTAQQVYRQGVFKIYRTIWQPLTAWVPVPVVVLLVPVVGFFFLRRRRRHRSLHRSGGWAWADVAALIVIWFLVSWGYNYNCPTVAELQRFEMQQLQEDQLEALGKRALQSIEALRVSFPTGLRESHLPEAWISELRGPQEDVLRASGIGISADVRVREIRPMGLLHRAGISGIYLPFSGEGHADAGAALIPRIFTVAHEMSHGYGVTDEGEANFIAFETLLQSEDPAFNYAAHVQMLRYSLGGLRRLDHERYAALRSCCSERLLQELEEIRAIQAKYPAFFPEFSAAVNDLYLRQQGVTAGVASYDGFLNLVAAKHPEWLSQP